MFVLLLEHLKYRASLNDVPDLKQMALTFNEIQMHKTGTMEREDLH
jgi:hypothetical protein